MRTDPILAILGLAALATSCAAVNPRAGVGDVERLVAARAPLTVAWPENAAAAHQVDATVEALLREELTVDDAVRIALLNNRGLRALYEELGVAEAELVQAGLLPNPVLSANVRFGLGPSGTGAELGLVQELLGALQIPLKRRVAASARDATRREVADAVLGLALDTKAAFYRLQGALQMLELRRRVVTATELSREVAERQHAAGGITDLDVATERALHEEARIELAEVESTVLAEREDLNTLLGLWGERTTWTVAARLPGLPPDEVPESGLESLAVSQRLDLEASRLRTQEELARYRLGRLWGLIPGAALGSAAERELEGGWSVGPALDLPIPIFDQRQTELAASAARIRAGDARHAALAVRIRADVRRARLKVAAARARAEHYAAVVLPLQTRIVAETQREYDAMLLGVFQLLQAKRGQIDAGRRYIETLTDYWVSRTELERSVGGELRLAAQPPSVDPLPPPAEGGAHRHHHGG